MGWLKKHLNPNPVKQIKNTIQDTKDSIKKPMAMMSGGSKSKNIASQVTPAITRKNANVNPADRARPVARTASGRLNITTGQGNAPAPRQIVSPRPVQATVPPVSSVRKTAARRTLSTLGTGKYRIK